MAHLVGTPNSDTLTGGGENDLIEGLAGNDWLTGGSGNDILYGGSGPDILFDGPGSDLAVLGADGGAIYADVSDPLGRDVFRGASAGSGLAELAYGTTQRISINFLTGLISGVEIGVDRIENISHVFAGSGNDVFRGDNGANNRFSGNAGNDAAIGNGGFDHLEGGEGDDSLNGGDGDDLLSGDDGVDYLVGGTGDDTINLDAFRPGSDIVKGEGGNDWISGGIDNDKLFGGDGNDVVFAGWGADQLWGGSGADRFDLYNIQETGPRSIICDFEDGIDKIGAVLYPDSFIASARDTAAGVAINYGWGDFLLIKNFTLAQLDLSDFI